MDHLKIHVDSIAQVWSDANESEHPLTEKNGHLRIDVGGVLCWDGWLGDARGRMTSRNLASLRAQSLHFPALLRIAPRLDVDGHCDYGGTEAFSTLPT